MEVSNVDEIDIHKPFTKAEHIQQLAEVDAVCN
jgi:hypothetical protein